MRTMTGRRLAVHVLRSAVAVAISAISLAILVWLFSGRPRLQFFSWGVIPVCIVLGYLPLWRWYPREAYPIGVVFVPTMFLLLRYLAARLEGIL
jgi:hypothetical protein